MDERKRILLSAVDTTGVGLEIGASYNPALPKGSGARVETVDHASRGVLVEKYTALGIPREQVDQIEDVDYVSDGRSLREVVGKAEAYDFILASHMIEHTLDLIGFLQDCEGLLKPEGVLSLAVPDNRWCFDLLRPLTSLSQVVDANRFPRQRHTPGAIVEYETYKCNRLGLNGWDPATSEPVQLEWPDAQFGPQLMESILAETEYHDVHNWKFTPGSFSLLVQDLRELGFHGLYEKCPVRPLGAEFFVALTRQKPAEPHRDRLELMQQVRRELAAVMDVDNLSLKAVEAQERLAECRQELANTTAAHESELAALNQVNGQLRGELDQLTHSRSWRLTAPLRAVRRKRP